MFLFGESDYTYKMFIRAVYKTWIKWIKTIFPNFSGDLLDIDSDAGNVYVLEAGLYSISASISIKAVYDTGINGDFEIGERVCYFKYRGSYNLKTRANLLLSTRAYWDI